MLGLSNFEPMNIEREGNRHIYNHHQT